MFNSLVVAVGGVGFKEAFVDPTDSTFVNLSRRYSTVVPRLASSVDLELGLLLMFSVSEAILWANVRVDETG